MSPRDERRQIRSAKKTPANFEPALFTDLYELTMLQAYRAEGMTGRATFSLFVRELPPQRNFLVAAGLDDALDYLERLRFSPAALDYLRTLDVLTADFVDSLADFRFSGDVYAMPEGTPVFAGEPLLEVDAPIGEAQLVETFLLNQLTVQTLIASKGVRAVAAANGKPVIDFGTRRAHGIDAALKSARALSIAGFQGTSNVEAGRCYGIPVTGTMAHSYVQAHDDEAAAFRAFVRRHPGATLLVDTYDTAAGVRRVVELARELGDDFTARAIRLDSGDLAALARDARAVLDAGGLQRVRIVASGGLDEHAIAELERADAPIDAYAVGTLTSTSADAPTLEAVYKLVAYAGAGRVKLQPGKQTLPGRKQVIRSYRNGEAVGDIIGTEDEPLDGEPLLVPVMRDGVALPDARPPLAAIRERAAREIARLPARLRALAPAQPTYAVEVSAQLAAAAEAARLRVGAAAVVRD